MALIWLVVRNPFPPTSTLGERILTDLRPWHSSKMQTPGGPVFRAQVAQGRKGLPGQPHRRPEIDPRPGGAKANIGCLRRCAVARPLSSANQQIEALWAKHQASLDLPERERLIKEIQRVLMRSTTSFPFTSILLCTRGPKVLPAVRASSTTDTCTPPTHGPGRSWEVKG